MRCRQEACFILVGCLVGSLQVVAQTYQIVPERSHISFTAQHMGFFKVSGHFKAFAGTILYDGDERASLVVEVAIEGASIDTDSKMRDRGLRGTSFLDVKQYPEITFKSKRIERTGEEANVIIGDITVHGITKEITIPFTLTTLIGEAPVSRRLHIEAAFTINRKDYALSFSPAMDPLVGDEVEVEIDVEAVEVESF